MIKRGTSPDIMDLVNFELSMGNEVWSVGAACGWKVFELRFDFNFTAPGFSELIVPTLQAWTHFDPHYAELDLRGFKSRLNNCDAVAFNLERAPFVPALDSDRRSLL